MSSIKELIYYDFSTDSLKYKVRCGRMLPGTDVGKSVNKSGYCQFQLKGKYYRYHRAVWEVCNGAIPEGKVIDHIDRVKTNNCINNLRLVSAAENAQNRRMHSSNTSKIPNVSWDKNNSKWIVQVGCKTRGRLRDIEQAASEAIYWHVYLNYHNTHGSI